MFNAKKPDAVIGAAPLPPATSILKPFQAYSNEPEAGYSIINEWLTMRGDLESSGDILVKGKVHGNVRCRMLIIDPEAQVEGGIWSEEIVIRGSTRGVIHAKRVRVERSGSVDSDIYHETFSIEEGARVRGSLLNYQDDDSARSNAPKPALRTVSSERDFAEAAARAEAGE